MNISKSEARPYLNRLGLILVVSILVSAVVNELAFRFQPGNVDRSARVIELVIPAGTAAQVAAGQPVPAIPEEMVFVLGDVLVVRNDDVETHVLGPLLVPPGTSASMSMDRAENIAMDCSFQSSSYLGVEVKAPTTLKTRLLALSFAAPPTTVVLFLYSLATHPIKAKDE